MVAVYRSALDASGSLGRKEAAQCARLGLVGRDHGDLCGQEATPQQAPELGRRALGLPGIARARVFARSLIFPAPSGGVDEDERSGAQWVVCHSELAQRLMGDVRRRLEPSIDLTVRWEAHERLIHAVLHCEHRHHAGLGPRDALEPRGGEPLARGVEIDDRGRELLWGRPSLGAGDRCARVLPWTRSRATTVPQRPPCVGTMARSGTSLRTGLSLTLAEPTWRNFWSGWEVQKPRCYLPVCGPHTPSRGGQALRTRSAVHTLCRAEVTRRKVRKRSTYGDVLVPSLRASAPRRAAPGASQARRWSWPPSWRAGKARRAAGPRASCPTRGVPDSRS
jgi:hypothetical protein